MTSAVRQIEPDPLGDLAGLAEAFETAESLIISTIERECEALRAGRHLAAQALRARLDDAARLYLDAAKAARASYAMYQAFAPAVIEQIESRRQFFSAVLKIELAALAAQRAAAQPFADGDVSLRT